MKEALDGSYSQQVMHHLSHTGKLSIKRAAVASVAFLNRLRTAQDCIAVYTRP